MAQPLKQCKCNAIYQVLYSFHNVVLVTIKNRQIRSTITNINHMARICKTCIIYKIRSKKKYELVKRNALLALNLS